MKMIVMRHCLLLFLIFGVMGVGSGVTLGQLEFDPAGVLGSADWNDDAGNMVWDNGGAVVWLNGSAAVFQNGVANTLTLTEGVSALSLLQSGVGTVTTIQGVGQQLVLTGTGLVVSNEGAGVLTFASGLTVDLSPVDGTLAQQWMVDSGALILVDALLTGDTGMGGLVKLGAGVLELNGENDYLGLTVLEEGILEVGSASALGRSTLLFEGGALRYGAVIAGGLSDQFGVLAGEAALIDTNGFNIVLNTALTGAGGLTKLGVGMLTLAASNTNVGDVRVEAGVLRVSNWYSATDASLNRPLGAGGATGNKIYISDGATLDLNGGYTSATYNNWSGGKYEVTVQGEGVDGLGAIRNTGASMTNFGPFSKITLLGDTTFGVQARWDISGTQIVADTAVNLTKIGVNEMAWGATAASSNLQNIYVKQGSLAPISGNNYGDVNYSIFISSGARLSPWNGQTVSKKLVMNPENVASEATISVNGDNVAAGGYSITNLNGEMTLAGATHLTSNGGRRDVKLNGKITSNGSLRITGAITVQSGDTATTERRRATVVYMTNSDNDFTSDVSINRGIVRMSDGTNDGKMGAGANMVTMGSTDANAYAIWDLFGTNQTVGALSGVGASNYVENDRAGTVSTLTVGTSNTVSASFAGTLRDYSEMLPYNVTYGPTAGLGTSGILAFEKVGTGRQILTAVNTFSGGTRVMGGELQVGDGATGGSAARLGNGNFEVVGGSLTGNGTVGHVGLQSEVNAGGMLSVGTFNQTEAQVMLLEGGLLSEGTLVFDVFAVTNGSGASSNSDMLKFMNDEMQTVEGVLQLVDRVGDSMTWGLDTWFQVFDWDNVAELNRSVSMTMGSMPVLDELYDWDLSRLATEGRVYVINAVPEPGKGLLLLVGMVGVVLGRWRRRV